MTLAYRQKAGHWYAVDNARTRYLGKGRPGETFEAFERRELDGFAIRVNRAAWDIGGPGAKVFIATVYARLAKQGRAASIHGASLRAFKARLLEAQRAELVALARADLVGAFSEQAIRDSEVEAFGGASFHFVRA